MADSPHNKRKCANCSSSQIRYYGYTLSGIYFYFQCLGCGKYTELRLKSKSLLIIYLIAVLIPGVIAAGYEILDSYRLAAFFLFFGFMGLLVALNIKYRWAGYEVTPLEKLPDRLIIPIVKNWFTRVLAVIFFLIIFTYAAVFIFNMIRQQ